jgi:hypothetical protein
MEYATPTSIKIFEHFLMNVGLKRTRDESPVDSMGYRCMEYIGDGIGIRLIRDRGFWEIKIAETSTQPDQWYHINLLTYCLPGQKQPNMSFEDQLTFAMAHWSQVVASFASGQRSRMHACLRAARTERANTLFARWPSVVLDFESFLKDQGLSCEFRKEPANMYADRTLRYANSIIRVEVSTENRWRIQFADMKVDPDNWCDFEIIRRLIQWPEDKKVNFIEKFKFIKDNWSEIIHRLTSVEYAKMREQFQYSGPADRKGVKFHDKGSSDDRQMDG